MSGARIPQDVIDRVEALDLLTVARAYGFTGKAPHGGGEAAGPCPGCGGRDRFAVNTRDNVWCCRQGGGAPVGGRAIDMVRHFENCSFRQAVEKLAGNLDDIAPRASAKADSDDNPFREKERRRAFDLWRAGRPFAAGGAVARYLAGRGLDARLARLPGAHCREAENFPFWHPVKTVSRVDGATETRWQVIWKGPAMLWPIVAADGHFLGLHATWIDLARPLGKAEIFDPGTGEQLPAKKIRGSQKGGRIVLRDRLTSSPDLAAGEGVETCLSWLALNPAFDGSLHCAATLGNLAGRAARSVSHPVDRFIRRDGRSMPVRFPGPDPRPDEDQSKLFALHHGVERLVLIGDGDSEPYATRAAYARAAARLARPGLAIATDWPAPGRDYNSMLTERMRQHVA